MVILSGSVKILDTPEDDWFAIVTYLRKDGQQI
jgi:hypothetical protein